LSTWNIPAAAKLGSYRIELDNPRRRAPPHSWSSGDFRVEEFRLPLVDARLSGPQDAHRAGHAAAGGVQMNYLGRCDGQAPLRASALLRERAAGMAGYDEFSFEPPRDLARGDEADNEEASRGEGRWSPTSCR
jgi:uncharacterized protein YfaS (alpha-2-macroglobulin family)